MKRRLLMFLVILIGFSCLGLIFIQYHWMNKSIESGISRFRFESMYSIAKAVNSFEKQVRHTYFHELKKDVEQLKGTGYLEKQFESHFPCELEFISGTEENRTLNIQMTIVPDENDKISSILSDPQLDDEKLNSFANKNESKQLSNFITRSNGHEDAGVLLSKTYPIKLSISFHQLDVLVKNSLRESGLYNQYNIAIYDTLSKQFYNPYNIKDTASLFTAFYKHPLFFSHVNEANFFLIIHFPNELEYIFNQVSYFLWTSFIFVSIMVVSFILALGIILKQRRLSEVKNDFINNMTHEIKTPIATISLATEALSDDTIEQNEELQKAYLRIIKDENNRLQLLVAQILNQARLDSGSQQPKKDPVNTRDIIEQCINNVKLILEQREGKIELVCKSDNPIIYGDEIHFTNIISNLFDNAIKYSPVRPSILISVMDTSSGLKIQIKDNGIGIHKREQKKIFDKFYRVSTGDVHDVKGYGVGLSYVKYAVQLFGGSIWIESELKKGAAFIMHFPKE